jgi:hypothetical protein
MCERAVSVVVRHLGSVASSVHAAEAVGWTAEATVDGGRSPACRSGFDALRRRDDGEGIDHRSGRTCVGAVSTLSPAVARSSQPVLAHAERCGGARTGRDAAGTGQSLVRHVLWRVLILAAAGRRHRQRAECVGVTAGGVPATALSRTARLRGSPRWWYRRPLRGSRACSRPHAREDRASRGAARERGRACGRAGVRACAAP